MTPSPARTGTTAAGNDTEEERGRGTLLTATAYLLWGGMPLYFALLLPAGPLEIVAHRVVWSLLVCLLLLWLLGLRRRRRGGLGGWATLRAVPRRSVGLLALAGGLIVGNWVVYVVAVNTGHVVEAALGYFINPVLSVLLGVVLLRERLSRARWVSVGISVVAVLVLTIGYGRPPWLSLGLALTFALYGLVKKTVRTDAVTSLTVETVWTAPLALLTLVLLGSRVTFGTEGVGHALLLVSAGLVTTVPLLCFGAGARRIPLSVVGLLQNLTPVLQFAVGLWVFGEQMPTVRWVGFVLVWLALAVLMVDVVVRSRRRPTAATPEPAP